ncbi:hypothetical protein ACHAWX_000895, partial [Stephanocyclus meneghinianus]
LAVGMVFCGCSRKKSTRRRRASQSKKRLKRKKGPSSRRAKQRVPASLFSSLFPLAYLHFRQESRLTLNRQMPRSLPVPYAAPAVPHYYPHPNLHELDRPHYPVAYPPYYPPHGPPAGSNADFLFDVHTNNDDDDGRSDLTRDLESKPSADPEHCHEQDEIHEHYNEQPELPNEDPRSHDDGASHNLNMRHHPPPFPHATHPHDVHPYYHPYYHPYPPPFPHHPPPPPTYHPPIYAPHDAPHPADPSHRKLRKNARSRARARTLRAELALLRRRPDKTPHELRLLHKHEERRRKKNVRTRQRAAEAKARMEEILAKAEEERSEEEREILRVGMEKRRRKNEGDRLRRVKLKEMGLSVKPPGMEIRGREDGSRGREWNGQGWSGGSLGYPMTNLAMMMMEGEGEGEQFGDLERHDLDKLMTEEVSELLMQDDEDEDDDEDVEKVMDH